MGCCGDPKSVGETIEKACGYLSDGHRNIAAMYRSVVASGGFDDEDTAALLEQAVKHEKMAEETAQVVLPTG